MAKKKKQNINWQQLGVLAASAFIFAWVIGNYSWYVGKDYQDPFLHLDWFTFISLSSFGVIGLIMGYFFNKKR